MYSELPPLGEEPRCLNKSGHCLAWPLHLEIVKSVDTRDSLLEEAMKLEYDGGSELSIQEKQAEAKENDHDAQMFLNQIRGCRNAGYLCSICPYKQH